MNKRHSKSGINADGSRFATFIFVTFIVLRAMAIMSTEPTHDISFIILSKRNDEKAGAERQNRFIDKNYNSEKKQPIRMW